MRCRLVHGTGVLDGGQSLCHLVASGHQNGVAQLYRRKSGGFIRGWAEFGTIVPGVTQLYRVKKRNSVAVFRPEKEKLRFRFAGWSGSVSRLTGRSVGLQLGCGLFGVQGAGLRASWSYSSRGSWLGAGRERREAALSVWCVTAIPKLICGYEEPSATLWDYLCDCGANTTSMVSGSRSMGGSLRLRSERWRPPVVDLVGGWISVCAERTT